MSYRFDVLADYGAFRDLQRHRMLTMEWQDLTPRHGYEMQADLDRERKAMTRLWAKREEQIRGVIESMAGMYGDLQGLIGSSLHSIPALSTGDQDFEN